MSLLHAAHSATIDRSLIIASLISFALTLRLLNFLLLHLPFLLLKLFVFIFIATLYFSHLFLPLHLQLLPFTAPTHQRTLQEVLTSFCSPQLPLFPSSHSVPFPPLSFPALPFTGTPAHNPPCPPLLPSPSRHFLSTPLVSFPIFPFPLLAAPPTIASRPSIHLGRGVNGRYEPRPAICRNLNTFSTVFCLVLALAASSMFWNADERLNSVFSTANCVNGLNICRSGNVPTSARDVMTREHNIRDQMDGLAHSCVSPGHRCASREE